VGLRALLPIATVRGSVVEWRIRDAEHKTVLRAYLSRSTVINGDGVALPARFSVIPVPAISGTPFGWLTCWRRWKGSRRQLRSWS
jgi:hypothetical protein